MSASHQNLKIFAAATLCIRILANPPPSVLSVMKVNSVLLDKGGAAPHPEMEFFLDFNLTNILESFAP
jgi:hypothetical protein